jgi:hypothetical protein
VKIIAPNIIRLTPFASAHLISAFLHGDNVAKNEAELARSGIFHHSLRFEAQPAMQHRSTTLRLHKRSPLPLDAEEVDTMLDRIVGKVDKHNEQANHKKSGKWADRGMVLMLKHHQGSKDQVKQYKEKLSGLTKDAGEEKKEKLEKTLKFLAAISCND